MAQIIANSAYFPIFLHKPTLSERLLFHFGDCFGDDVRKVRILQLMHFGGYSMRVITGLDGTCSLEDDVAVVKKLIDIMYGDA